MIELNLGPDLGTEMAVAALARIVIRWTVASVARSTVRLASVTEGNLGPILRGGVTVAALAREMIGWTVTAVTSPAVGETSVIELNYGPGFGTEVAVTALAGIVIRWTAASVACSTIGNWERLVIKFSLSPDHSRVTRLTLRAKYPVMRFIRGVAPLASGWCP
jgi:hypothetical protein